jgi:hypothetical protein
MCSTEIRLRPILQDLSSDLFPKQEANVDIMTKIEVESFSSAINAAVIRLPGRKFPGIVLQGDSLKILTECAEDIGRLVRESEVSELTEAADHLMNLLETYLSIYEEALKKHNHPLPY